MQLIDMPTADLLRFWNYWMLWKRVLTLEISRPARLKLNYGADSKRGRLD